MSPPDTNADQLAERERFDFRIRRTNERAAAVADSRTTGVSLSGLAERFVAALVYSSAYLAVIAAAQVAVVMMLLSVRPNPAPLVVGLITFAIYANDRLLDVDTDEITSPDQSAFVRRYRRPLYALAAGAYGVAVALSVLGGPTTLSITLFPAVFWVLYATDWIPDLGLGVGVTRLKQLLLVNSAVVALAWAVSLVFLPLGFAGEAFSPAAAVVFAYFFLGVFANAELPNVYDVEGDRALDVRTLPVVVGITRTRHALYAIDGLLALLVGAAFVSGVFSLALALPLFVGLAYSTGVTALLGRVEDGRRHVIAAESEYLLVAGALLVSMTLLPGQVAPFLG